MDKILFVDKNLPYLLAGKDHNIGGSTIQQLAWIKGFSRIGQRIGVLSTQFNFDLPLDDTLKLDLVQSFDASKGVKGLRWFFYRLPTIKNSIKSYQPTYVLHFGAGLYSGILAHICKRLKVPFFIRLANDMNVDERFRTRMSRYTQYVYQYGLRNCSGFICQNNYQLKMLDARFPEKPKTILYNPFDSSFINTQVKPFNERSYIAWLGVIQKQKNLPALLKVVKQLPHRIFKVGGEPIHDIDIETKAAYEQLKRCTNVEFLGYLKRDQVKVFLNSAYALLNTSHYEGMSNTFLESFACGTPVVTTEAVNPDQIVSKHQLGRVAPSHEHLAQVLEQFLSDKEALSQIFENCQFYVKNNHDTERLASDFQQFLKRASSK